MCGKRAPNVGESVFVVNLAVEMMASADAFHLRSVPPSDLENIRSDVTPRIVVERLAGGPSAVLDCAHHSRRPSRV